MVARRMANVPESGTVKIANVVSKLKAEGVKDMISFSMGEPDFHTPEHITEACIGSLHDHETYYTPSAGIPELRQAVANDLSARNGLPCSSSNVLITPTKHAIFMTMLALVEEGDEVIVPDPAWGTFDACARLAGAKVRYAKLDTENGYRMTPSVVGEQITDRTRLVLINTPSNPCGAVMRPEDVKGVADLCRDHDLYVLSDEIYERLIFEGNHTSIGSLDGMFDRTVTIGGFSKTYAMTGWRIGWAVAAAPIFNELNKLQTQSITCVTSFTQRAGLKALQGSQEPVQRMAQEFKARRDLIYELVSDIPQLHCPKPSGAFYLFPSYDIDMPSEDLAAYLLEKAHVAVTPGSAFGPAGEGRIRISYATSRKDIIEGMARLRVALDGL